MIVIQLRSSMKKINYNKLNPKQQESYNFQKVSSVLADYGFTTIKLSDDWQGADFIAQNIDGNTFLKIQLKGRLTLSKKYLNKDLYICFPYKDNWYLFPHDIVVNQLSSILENYQNTKSWKVDGLYSINTLSRKILDCMQEYIL